MKKIQLLCIALTFAFLVSAIPFSELTANGEAAIIENDMSFESADIENIHFLASSTGRIDESNIFELIGISESGYEILSKTLLNAAMEYKTSVDISSFNIRQRYSTSYTEALLGVVFSLEPVLMDNVSSCSFTVDEVTGIITEINKIRYQRSKTEQDRMVAECEAVAAELLRGIIGNNNLSEFEKALVIHDRLAVHMDFLSPKYNNLYGALVDRRGHCVGFSNAYKYLMQLAGVKCYRIISAELSHTWNEVKIEGKRYHVDVSNYDWSRLIWVKDKPLENYYARHKAFLVSSERYHEDYYYGDPPSLEDKPIDYDTTPEDETFNDFFWRDIYTPFILSNGTIYYCVNNYVYDHENTSGHNFDGSDNGLYTFKYKNDIMETQKIIDAGGDSMLIASTIFDDLYYSLGDSIYKFDPSDYSSSLICKFDSFPNEYVTKATIIGFGADNEFFDLKISYSYPEGFLDENPSLDLITSDEIKYRYSARLEVSSGYPLIFASANGNLFYSFRDSIYRFDPVDNTKTLIYRLDGDLPDEYATEAVIKGFSASSEHFYINISYNYPEGVEDEHPELVLKTDDLIICDNKEKPAETEDYPLLFSSTKYNLYYSYGDSIYRFDPLDRSSVLIYKYNGELPNDSVTEAVINEFRADDENYYFNICYRYPDGLWDQGYKKRHNYPSGFWDIDNTKVDPKVLYDIKYKHNDNIVIPSLNNPIFYSIEGAVYFSYNDSVYRYDPSNYSTSLIYKYDGGFPNEFVLSAEITGFRADDEYYYINVFFDYMTEFWDYDRPEIDPVQNIEIKIRRTIEYSESFDNPLLICSCKSDIYFCFLNTIYRYIPSDNSYYKIFQCNFSKPRVDARINYLTVDDDYLYFNIFYVYSDGSCEYDSNVCYIISVGSKGHYSNTIEVKNVFQNKVRYTDPIFYQFTDPAVCAKEGYVFGIREKTKVPELNNICLNDLIVLDANGGDMSRTQYVGTGYLVRSLNDERVVVSECIAVIKGDIDGDGEVTNNDYILLKSIYKNQFRAKEYQLLAADINENGKLTIADYLMIKRYVRGTYDIFLTGRR